MVATHVAFLRGINVGKAKRVAMADLRALITDLGYRDARTLLNSGNAVFSVPRGVRGNHAGRIQEEIEGRLGVTSRVTVLTVGELAEIVAHNPLMKVADNPSRLLITILANPADRSRLLPLTKEDWAPDALAIGARAAYLWCARGMLESRLAQRTAHLLGDAATSRNWATLTKLDLLAREGG